MQSRVLVDDTYISGSWPSPAGTVPVRLLLYKDKTLSIHVRTQNSIVGTRARLYAHELDWESYWREVI